MYTHGTSGSTGATSPHTGCSSAASLEWTCATSVRGSPCRSWLRTQRCVQHSDGQCSTCVPYCVGIEAAYVPCSDATYIVSSEQQLSLQGCITGTVVKLVLTRTLSFLPYPCLWLFQTDWRVQCEPAAVAQAPTVPRGAHQHQGQDQLNHQQHEGTAQGKALTQQQHSRREGSKLQ